MSRRVKNNIDQLRALVLMKPNHRIAVLKAADLDLIHSVCECAYNLLKGNVCINSSKKTKLKRFKNVLRRLVKKGESLKTKKRYIIQKGGGIFIPLLLSTVLQALLK